MTNLQAFTKFTGEQPADKHYQFMDCQGNCAVGQWMKSTGQKWDMDIYRDLVREMFGPEPDAHSSLVSSETFGELHKALVDA